ncbi:MAG TPA: sugar ABC transporter ATP-binding protein [Bauldia sp.]|nr:sugar ABC transporter ATP-binding protein [Bauldia sp.]
MIETAAPALELKALSKRFPGVLALDNASLTVRRGEIHAVIGQNGAGKSTMINVLAGMLAADAGEIVLSGRAVAIQSTAEAIALGIATVYQELSLLPNLTIAENIALGREPFRNGLLDRSAMRTRAKAALERMNLDMNVDVRIGSLSLAERQLVEIAKALSHHPTVLVLDEPTAALAQRETERLFAVLRRLRSEGMAIVYVSHRFREILDLCDRATVLRNGRVVATTELAELTEADLTEAMVGSATELYRREGGTSSGEVRLECAGLSWRGRVHDVGFRVHAGEIVGLTGLLGAGQNEVARMLGGDLVPSAGTIRVNRHPVAMRSPADGVAAGICLLTDERKSEGILPNLALRENIALPSMARRRAGGMFVAAGAERAAVADEVRQFGVVTSSIEVPIRTLSGGNQQKALIARWHLADAAVFVLIEPTRGVDVAARAEIYRRLDALAAAGKAIVFVSSEIPELLALADRILVLRDGRVVRETRPAETGEERLNLLIQGAR